MTGSSGPVGVTGATGIANYNSPTLNYIAKVYTTGPTVLTNSIIYDNGAQVGIGTSSPISTFTVNGDIAVSTVSGVGRGVIFPEGMRQVSAAPFGNVAIASAAGGSSWPVPPGVTKIWVEVYGGGGGGGGGGTSGAAGGGGAGGVAMGFVNTATCGGPCAYTVGSGGTAGPATFPGVNGTGSTFGSLSAGFGSAGAAGQTLGTGVGGSGGVGTAGVILLQGGAGGEGAPVISTGVGGPGGSNMRGGGGAGGVTAGGNGGNCGGGGGGGGLNANGGPGGNGCVIIWW